MQAIIVTTEEDLRKIFREELRAISETLGKLSRDSKPTDPNDFLIPRLDVKDELNVSLVTLRSWEKKNILVPRRIGRRVFYRRSDVIGIGGRQ